MVNHNKPTTPETPPITTEWFYLDDPADLRGVEETIHGMEGGSFMRVSPKILGYEAGAMDQAEAVGRLMGVIIKSDTTTSRGLGVTTVGMGDKTRPEEMVPMQVFLSDKLTVPQIDQASELVVAEARALLEGLQSPVQLPQ
jgi:hypothetical protein